MRAVNLIPEDARRGGGSSGRSGGAVYVVLAALAIVVALLATHTVLGSKADDAQARADALTAQATQVEAQATALQGQTSFATLRAKRVDTVQALVRSRFDWAHALRELARTVPPDVTLEGLTASLTPGAGSGSATGATGAGGSLRGSLPNPAFELQGCAADQDQVASMLTDLRRIDDVVRVSLESSEETGSSDTAGSSSGSDAASSCSGSARPSFSAVVFFQPPAGAAVTPTGSTTP